MISVVCTQSIKIICVLCYFTSEVVLQMQRVGSDLRVKHMACFPGME